MLAQRMHTGSGRQREIYLRGIAGKRERVPADATTLEALAKRSMSDAAWAYVRGGAGSERTVAANRADFDAHMLRPAMLRGISQLELEADFFGERVALPMFLAPIGVLGMVDHRGDLAVARAAAATGIPWIFSNQASESMEDCSARMGESARCFQLYWSTDDDVVSSLVARAEATGCRAIIVTLDTTYLGWRPRDLNRGFLPFLDAHGLAQYTTDPVFMRKAMEAPASDATAPLSWKALATALQQARRVPGSSWKNLRSGRARAAVSYFVQSYTRANLRWEDIPRLRDMTHLPIVLKGILRADDARRAIDAGADAIYVSNHGGRQIDGAISSLHALKAIAAAVRGELSIWFDSGIRNGADIVKALALGADLVGIGRPYVYGLALDGAAGVEAVVANLAAELDLTMRLVGARTVADLRNSNMVASHS